MYKSIKHFLSASLMAFVLFMQTGCIGTLMGMTVGEGFTPLPNPPDNKIYAGVRFDASTMGEIASDKENKPSPIVLPLLLIDLPLSFAADTVLLPYTIPDAIINSSD